MHHFNTTLSNWGICDAFFWSDFFVALSWHICVELTYTYFLRNCPGISKTPVREWTGWRCPSLGMCQLKEGPVRRSASLGICQLGNLTWPQFTLKILFLKGLCDITYVKILTWYYPSFRNNNKLIPVLWLGPKINLDGNPWFLIPKY